MSFILEMQMPPRGPGDQEPEDLLTRPWTWELREGRGNPPGSGCLASKAPLCRLIRHRGSHTPAWRDHPSRGSKTWAGQASAF